MDPRSLAPPRLRLRAPALPRVRRPAPHTLLIAVVAVLVLTGGWLWLRDSALVSVRQVSITGAAGPQAAAIRSAASAAARDMTTLHVREDALRTALKPFATVQGVRAGAEFPHRLRVEIVERELVGIVVVDGREVAVAADGRLLNGVATTGLPALSIAVRPGTERIADRHGRATVELLAAAPRALRPRVARVYTSPRGLTARLRRGPSLVFGAGDRVAAKWAAASAVLADPSSAGATSIDLRVPERPAAAGLEQISTQGSLKP